jgi:hypothetical protein
MLNLPNVWDQSAAAIDHPFRSNRIGGSIASLGSA